MANQVDTLIRLVDDHWEVTAEVAPGGTLPLEVFTYENTGDSTLGGYYGTCSVEELGRYQIWQGNPIPLFGNRFVRHGQAKIVVSLADDPKQVVATIIKNLTSLSLAYQSRGEISETYTIP